MQISSIQNYNTKSNFKGYTITPQANKLAARSPEIRDIANKAKARFEHSKHIHFNILDGLVPEVIITRTQEKLVGATKAIALKTNALRVSDSKGTAFDFLLPHNKNAKIQEQLINEGIKNPIEKASYIAELIRTAAHDHHERYII